MDFIPWEDRYSVGNDYIDRQHQKLVDLINKLHKALRNGEGAEYTGSVLNDLAAYTRYHFSAEEGYLKQANYPGLEEHQAKHRKMTQQVRDLQQRFASGEQLTMEVMDFLKNWLMLHIMKTDKKYTPYLKDVVRY